MFSAVRGAYFESICPLSIGIEDLPRIIDPSKAAMCPHKGGTRWNNAISEEEEPDRRSQQIAMRGKKEGTVTTEGREKKGEMEKRGQKREKRGEEKERREV